MGSGLQLFRWTTLIAGFAVGLVNVVGALQGPRDVWITQSVMLVFWLICSWVLTRKVSERLKPWERILAVFQVLLAFVTVIDLAYITAAQVSLYTPQKRRVLMWLVLESLALLVAGSAAYSGSFVVSDSLVGVPYVLAMALTTLQVMIWISFAALAGHLIVELEIQRRELAWTNGELRGTESLLAEAARVNERLRIARELHDIVGHHLVSLTLNLEIAERKANLEARTSIERAQLVARLLLAETREVISTMREDNTIDLREALMQLIESVPGPKVELQLDMAGDLDAAQAQVLFRSCEEALTNVHRHADAETVKIVIQQGPKRLNLVIQDDGRGQREVSAGNGLRGMQERFIAAGGGLGWSSVAGKGFTLMGWLPV